MVVLASGEKRQTPPFAHHSPRAPEQGTTGVWHLEPWEGRGGEGRERLEGEGDGAGGR